MKHLLPQESIETRIFLVRGVKVILDRDLAYLYGASTKRLNEQVKRNHARFPEDFMFQLTEEEKNEVVANCDHLKTIKYASTLPYAFTVVFDAIRRLLAPPEKKKERIGFYKE